MREILFAQAPHFLQPGVVLARGSPSRESNSSRSQAQSAATRRITVAVALGVRRQAIPAVRAGPLLGHQTRIAQQSQWRDTPD